jgi:hypothetical protein
MSADMVGVSDLKWETVYSSQDNLEGGGAPPL